MPPEIISSTMPKWRHPYSWRAPSIGMENTKKHVVWTLFCGYTPNQCLACGRYCANVEAIRYESRNLNRIVADRSHSVIVFLVDQSRTSMTMTLDDWSIIYPMWGQPREELLDFWNEGANVLNWDLKELVKLIQWVKIAHSFLQYVSNMFYLIILSFAM